MQLPSPNLQLKNPPVRFCAAAGSGGVGLDPVTDGLDKVFRKIGASRGREMIAEDFVGFGLFRTVLDLFRGYFYGNGTLNIPAAGERFFRESTSIFTDNVLSGIAAKGVGSFFDRNGQAFSNGFTDFPTLEMFQKILKENPVSEGKDFIKHLGESLMSTHKAPEGVTADKAAFKTALQEIWKNDAFAKEQLVEKATDLAKTLGQDHFDIQVGQNTFKLDNLLDDLRIFKTHMQEKEKQGLLAAGTGAGKWAEAAKDSIQKTLKAKNWKLLCVLLGMTSTFAMPLVNVLLTKRAYGIDYYPGETGLRQKQNQAGAGQQSWNGAQPPSKGFVDKYFPYVAENFRKGKFSPLLWALAPLPFALGLFNVATMRPANLLKKGVLRNMFDFCKEAPFTAQQQMASIFALLITSRLLCARSDNEFRERMVDSFAGWGLWILGTPIIKKLFAIWSDTKKGTLLQKTLPNGAKALRTRAEIESLLKPKVTPEVFKATKAAHIRLTAGSTIASMVLLGIVEPLIGILWTKHNEKKKQEAAARQSAAVSVNRLQPAFSTASPMRLSRPANGWANGQAAMPTPFFNLPPTPFSSYASIPAFSQPVFNTQSAPFAPKELV